jgi:hypothetical protein
LLKSILHLAQDSIRLEKTVLLTLAFDKDILNKET